MKKVLLLGSNGQLGNDIQKVFTDVELIPVTRAEFDIEKDDISKLEEYQVDCIINTTSYHKTDECEDFADKAFKINSSFAYQLAKLSQKNATTLFHISTDYVFSGETNKPYCEQDIPSPNNIYGLSKYAGEVAIQKYSSKYFIFRVSSLFGEQGASGKGGNFVETMISLAKKQNPLKIIADQHMSPTHTLDIAKAIYNFIKNDVTAYGLYHCSNNGSCSWYEFTKKIFELADIQHPVAQTTYDEYRTKAKRPKYSVLDNKKLEAYYQMPTWEEALTEYLTIKQHRST